MADQEKPKSSAGDYKPKSSAGDYKSDWDPQAYYNENEDGYCPVFPDPNDKQEVPVEFAPMQAEHVRGNCLFFFFNSVTSYGKIVWLNSTHSIKM